jgi:hypothetical protein
MLQDGPARRMCATLWQMTLAGTIVLSPGINDITVKWNAVFMIMMI